MARRTMEQRNRAAQERLRALGRDAGPVKGAEYRLRVALGELRGITPSVASGKPRAGEQGLRARARAGRPVAPAPSSTWRTPRLPKVVDFGAAGRVTNTRSGRAVRDELRRARDAGQQVAVYVTADGGRGPKTRVIDGRGGQGELLRAGGGGGEGRGVERGVEVIGKLRIVAGPADSIGPGGGIDPGDLLDFIEDGYGWDDFWDAFADLWDTDY